MSFVVGLTIQPIAGVSNSTWVRMAAKLGLEHIEFDPLVFDDVQAITRELKCSQVGIHSPYMKDYGIDLSSVHRREEVGRFISQVNAIAEEWNVVGVVVHPPSDAKGSFEYFLESLGQLEPTVLLENVFGEEGPGVWTEFLEFWERTRDRVGGNVGFCFDIPHSFIANGPVEYLRLPEMLRSELCHSGRGYIHLSGGRSTEDTHSPLNQGEIPVWTEVAEFLKPFRGTLNLELRPESQADIPLIIDSYLQAVRLSSIRKYLWRLLLLAAKRRAISEEIRKLGR